MMRNSCGIIEHACGCTCNLPGGEIPILTADAIQHAKTIAEFEANMAKIVQAKKMIQSKPHIPKYRKRLTNCTPKKKKRK